MAEAPIVRRERSDVRPKLVGWLALIVAGTVGLVPLSLGLLFPGSLHDPARQPTLTSPAPRLQSAPRDDLAALRQAEQRRLESYGWADRSAGLAHIPIEEAMRRVAQNGISDWPGGKP